MNIGEIALQKHQEWGGKIEIVPTCPLETAEDLSIAYTPGVASPCVEISKDKNKVYDYCRKGNLVAVVTDGTAVLGLGDIGPEAGMPVMEGKSVLFKAFGDVDAFPICLATKDVEEIVQTVKLMAPSFGGINLEDIAAPRCFEIEKRLKEELDIPVFHDDQHGTAIACTRLLLEAGLKNVIMCDINGALCPGKEGMNSAQAEMAELTNPNRERGTLGQVIQGADFFLGVSAAGCLKPEMVEMMNENPIIFAMANPTPEIFPEEALAAGAAVVGTGRSDFPNQINNVLVFPGLFRGALDVRARDINGEMKLAAAMAIADYIPAEELAADNIIPKALDRGVANAVAEAVKEAAIRTGVARV